MEKKQKPSKKKRKVERVRLDISKELKEIIIGNKKLLKKLSES